MRLFFLRFILGICVAGLIFISCKKSAPFNKPPVANAGPDQVINLPTDSVLLDANASGDLDGKIIGFQWTKISGPSSFSMINSSTAKSIVKQLVKGLYRFELKVTDDGGLTSRDTMQVMVDSIVKTNHPPVANAGKDTTIILPSSTGNLDGSASADPDNNITSYIWTKISGPSPFNIANTGDVQTQVTNLVQGAYQFELKVTDAGGLFSKDTVQVTLQQVEDYGCDISNRLLINAKLTWVGKLSRLRDGVAVASLANKLFIAGGFTPANGSSSQVDIFDINTNTWTTTALSQARGNITTAVLGNKIFFAGGYDGTKNSSRVDMYDAVTNTWSQAELSAGRSEMVGAATGNKVLFAAGRTSDWDYSNTVDIYDVSPNKWSTASLSNRTNTGTVGIAATAIGNKIYFAGEASDWWAWDLCATHTIVL